MNILKRNVIIGILLLLFSATLNLAYAQRERKLVIFYSPGCHKCIKVKEELIPQIEKKFKGQINIEYRNIDQIENYKLLLSLEEKHKAKVKNTLPVFYLEGRILNAEASLETLLEVFISEALNRDSRDQGLLPQVDLVSRFKNFRPLLIISAGLIDGINPCAFTVIVFFISFLTLQGYKIRELILVGSSFILALFIAYLLIGMGLFGFLYRIRGFWIVLKIVNFSIGIFSIILGVFSIYDICKFKKTRETEGLLLQLPPRIKKRIHDLIGLHFRKDKDSPGKETRASILRLIFSAFITGFLVTILEAVCTGQTYLPTIAFILKTTPFKLQASGYLLLYNLMFIVPLVAIFLLALSGVSSAGFSKFLKRNLLAIKLLMAILFFSLGILIIWNV